MMLDQAGKNSRAMAWLPPGHFNNKLVARRSFYAVNIILGLKAGILLG